VHAASQRGGVRVWHNPDDPVRDIQERKERHPGERRAAAKGAAASPTVGANNGCGEAWDDGVHRAKPGGGSSAKHGGGGRCGGSRDGQHSEEEGRNNKLINCVVVGVVVVNHD